MATREKEKGNEAFKSGDYEEAVKYYTRWADFWCGLILSFKKW